jgi:D-sedoheptulose 7-phosphate isomerase
MAKDVTIKLTAAQKAKIKAATGKNLAEIRVSSLGKNVAVSAGQKSTRAISAEATRMSLRGEGLRAEGLRGEGLRGEGLRGEGLRGEGLRGEGLRGEGLRGEGLRGEGLRGSGDEDV